MKDFLKLVILSKPFSSVLLINTNKKSLLLLFLSVLTHKKDSDTKIGCGEDFLHSLKLPIFVNLVYNDLLQI